MRLYADECFSRNVVRELRRLGHDVLRVQDDNRRGIDNAAVLARAHNLGRAVLTHNRSDYRRLHRSGVAHSGIVAVSQAPGSHQVMADRIHAALAGLAPGRWCVRVNRPPRP